MRFFYWLVLALNLFFLTVNIASGSPFAWVSVAGIGFAVFSLFMDSKARATRRRIDELNRERMARYSR